VDRNELKVWDTARHRAQVLFAYKRDCRRLYEPLELASTRSSSCSAYRATIIEPGSAESHEIQEAALNRKHWSRKDAANYTLTHSDRPPLKEKTICNICLDLQHAAFDPNSPKCIKQLRCLCIEYTYNLEKVAGITIEEAAEQEWKIDADCVLIGVYEYALDFGGAGHKLLNALEMEGYLRRCSKHSA
jgi:hypothetical protein